jgi:hypothetical protein
VYSPEPRAKGASMLRGKTNPVLSGPRNTGGIASCGTPVNSRLPYVAFRCELINWALSQHADPEE